VETVAEVDPTTLFAGEVVAATVSDVGEAAAPAEGSTTYVLDTDASMMHWHGAKLAYGHHGTINLADGSFSVTEGKLTAGSVSADMTSLVNLDLEDAEKNAKLVGHLKSDDFFSVEAHPTAEFVFTGVETAEDGTTMLSGNLTIKGITHQLTFPAEVSVTGDGMTAKALFSFDRSKYDVKFNSGTFFENLGDNLIVDEIGLYLDLKAVPETSENAG
jgi:polyisoprenoid-binding protein YceI